MPSKVSHSASKSPDLFEFSCQKGNVVKSSIQFSYGDLYDSIVARLHKSRDKGEMEKKGDIAWLQV